MAGPVEERMVYELHLPDEARCERNRRHVRLQPEYAILSLKGKASRETRASPTTASSPEREEGCGSEETYTHADGGLLGGAPVHLRELGEGIGLLDALDDPAVF